MKGCLIGSCVLLLLALVIIGKSSGWDLTYVQVLNNAFSPDQVQITEGDSIYFQNKVGAKSIVICLGRQGKCTPHASGPSDLQNRGITLGTAETRGIEFDNQGIYAVTSPQQTKMNLLVNVSRSIDSSGESGAGSSGNSGSGGYSGGSTGGDNYGGYGGNGGSNDDENGSNSSGGGGDDGGE